VIRKAEIIVVVQIKEIDATHSIFDATPLSQWAIFEIAALTEMRPERTTP